MKALAHKLKLYWRIFLCQKKINIQERMIYRFSFCLMSLSVFILQIITIFFFHLVFGWVRDINGWNYYQVLLIVGTTMLVDGLLWVSCAYTHALRHYVRLGNFDGILTKPVDSQFLISIVRGDIEDMMRIFTSLGIIIYAVAHFNLGLFQLLLGSFVYLLLVINSLVIMYSISIMMNAIVFWTIEGVSTFDLSDTVIRAAQYPVDIYSNKLVRLVFTLLVPAAFIGTYPAQMLAKGFDWRLILTSIILAFLFFKSSRFVWKKALAKYSSASS